MVETKNMFLPNEEIYENLKTYINSKASVETWVGRNKTEKQNPMIIFEEPRNELESYSTTYNNTTRVMSYNIEIYCSTLMNSYEIVKELALLVVEVMQVYYKMNGGLTAIIPTFDNKNKISYQATLRFSTRFKPNRNKLF